WSLRHGRLHRRLRIRHSRVAWRIAAHRLRWRITAHRLRLGWVSRITAPAGHSLGSIWIRRRFHRSVARFGASSATAFLGLQTIGYGLLAFSWSGRHRQNLVHEFEFLVREGLAEYHLGIAAIRLIKRPHRVRISFLPLHGQYELLVRDAGR